MHLGSKVKLKKWSRSESESEQGAESRGRDPKPSDLPLARVKPP